MKSADLFSMKGKVALVARRADRLEAFKAELEKGGAKAVAIAADVTRREDMIRAFDAAERALGPLTTLVNNAGVAQASIRATSVSEDEWRRVLSVDLDAVFYWAQEAARRMIAAGTKGSIVNIASVLGFGAQKGVASYATAKAGVVQITRVLGLELAFKGVRVNAIAPGWFVTEINDKFLASEAGGVIRRSIPMGRFGNEGDLSGALLLLASDAGAYMTGTTIVVDGGQLSAIHG